MGPTTLKSSVRFDMEAIAREAMYPDDVTEHPFTEVPDMNREMQLIAERYRAEDALTEAIRAGKEDSALDALQEYSRIMQSPLQRMCLTSKDPLRDLKNGIIMMNAMLRKAALDAHVPPFYVHYPACRISYEIDGMQSIDELPQIVHDMVVEYCTLIRRHSLACCGNLVRRAVLYIQENLCGSISTSDIAVYLNISPNYLSNRFKSEVGSSVTDYIRAQRMGIAAYLLTTTDLSVTEIAGRIGIDSSAWFTRQFKAVMGCAPLQYRKSHARETNSK